MKLLSSVVLVILAALAVFIVQSRRAQAAPTPTRFELAQTIPDGTELAQADLRSATDIWIEMIRSAKRTIDLGQFYASSSPGSALTRVLDELEEAGKRGVRTRFLVSNALFDEDPKTIERLKTIPGLTLRVFNIEKQLGGILHAKYWIVDGNEVFIGSQNFDWRALTHIHETGVRVQDSKLAQQLGRIFDTDWKIAETGKLPSEPKHPATAEQAKANSVEWELVASPPRILPAGIRHSLVALLELIQSAKKSVTVQLLEYSPIHDKTQFWGELDNALRAAAARGVKVRMMVSDWNSGQPHIGYLKSLSLVPGVELKMVTIPKHKDGFVPFARVIHSKLMTIDDSKLWVGTSNWSHGYFYEDRGVELVVRKPELAQKGVQIFDKLWESSYASKVDPLKEYVMPKRDKES